MTRNLIKAGVFSSVLFSSVVAYSQSPCDKILSGQAQITSISQLTEDHFKCVLSDFITKNPQQALASNVNLSESITSDLKFANNKVTWKLKGISSFKADSKETIEEELKQLKNNAIQAWGGLSQELLTQIQWDISVETTTTPPPPPPPPTSEVKLVQSCESHVVYEQRSYCKTVGLFGLRTKLVTECCPTTVTICTWKPVADNSCGCVQVGHETASSSSNLAATTIAKLGADKADATADLEKSNASKTVRFSNPMRAWFSNQGTQSYAKGRVLEIQDSRVILLMEDLEIASCSIDQLCDSDREYLSRWTPGKDSGLEFRKFFDNTGKWQAELALIDVESDHCRFLRKDGSIVRTPLDRLSGADKSYIASLQKKNLLLAGISK